MDKRHSYPPAIDDLKADEQLPETTQLRQVKYLNNRVEQEHRFIKRLTKPGMGFDSFNMARRTIRGLEASNMLRKGQVKAVDKDRCTSTDRIRVSSFRSCPIRNRD